MDSQLQTVARYTIEGSSYYSPLISMKRGGSSYWYLYDGLGSTRKLIDSNQNVTDSYSYEAFGDITSSSGSTTNPYRYVGALGYSYSSIVTSLLHVGARYYAPGLGRFMGQDPERPQLKSPTTLAAYLYCGNNPLTLTDPSGMSFLDPIWGGLKDIWERAKETASGFWDNAVKWVVEQASALAHDLWKQLLTSFLPYVALVVSALQWLASRGLECARALVTLATVTLVGVGGWILFNATVAADVLTGGAAIPATVGVLMVLIGVGGEIGDAAFDVRQKCFP
jgi:RHS repeat-associated protein